MEEGDCRAARPRTGFLVDGSRAGGDRLPQDGGAIVDPVPDVVQSLTPAVKEPGDRGIRACRGEQLDVRVGDAYKGLFHAVAVDHFTVDDLRVEGIQVPRNGRIQIADSDGDVIHLGQ